MSTERPTVAQLHHQPHVAVRRVNAHAVDLHDVGAAPNGKCNVHFIIWKVHVPCNDSGGRRGFVQLWIVSIPFPHSLHHPLIHARARTRHSAPQIHCK